VKRRGPAVAGLFRFSTGSSLLPQTQPRNFAGALFCRHATPDWAADWPPEPEQRVVAGRDGNGAMAPLACATVAPSAPHRYASSAETYHFVGGLGQKRPVHPKDALPCQDGRAARAAGRQTGADLRRRSKRRIRRDARPGQRRTGRAEQLAEGARRARGAGRRASGQKSPRDSNCGDRSLGKSRTAVSGAIAASADQPRRALIWINRA